MNAGDPRVYSLVSWKKMPRLKISVMSVGNVVQVTGVRDFYGARRIQGAQEGKRR